MNSTESIDSIRKRAILLTRVSTDSQFERGTIEAQRKELIAFALADSGLSLEDFELIESSGGESATQLELDERETIQKLRSTIAHHKIESVYVWAADRLCRDPTDLLILRREFLKQNINLISKTDPNARLFDREGKPTDTLISLFLTGWKADEEGKTRLARIKMGKEKKMELGCYIGGNRPFGYSFKKQNKYNSTVITEPTVSETKFVPHPIESEVVQDIFNLYATGKFGQNTLYDEIKLKYPTIKLQISLIGKILRNPIYAGEKSNKNPLRTFPAIIDKELFDQCENVRNKKNMNLPKSKTVYYAHRLIKCNFCNGFLKALKAKMNYRCENKWNKTSKIQCTNYDSININVVDYLVWKVTKKLLIHDTLESKRNRIKELEKEIENTQTEIENNDSLYNIKLDDEINKLQRMYKDMPIEQIRTFAASATEPTKKELNNKNISLKRKIAELKKHLDTVIVNERDRDNIYLNLLDSLDVEKGIIKTEEEKRDLCKQYITDVRIFNEPGIINGSAGVKKIVINNEYEYYYAAMKKEKSKRLFCKQHLPEVLREKLAEDGNDFIYIHIDYTDHISR